MSCSSETKDRFIDLFGYSTRVFLKLCSPARRSPVMLTCNKVRFNFPVTRCCFYISERLFKNGNKNNELNYPAGVDTVFCRVNNACLFTAEVMVLRIVVGRGYEDSVRVFLLLANSIRFEDFYTNRRNEKRQKTWHTESNSVFVFVCLLRNKTKKKNEDNRRRNWTGSRLCNTFKTWT